MNFPDPKLPAAESEKVEFKASFNEDVIETDEIIAFIKKHLMVEYIITGEPQRTERFDYPLDAVRELVIKYF